MALVTDRPLNDLAVDDDYWPTESSVAQEEVEANVCRLYVLFKGGPNKYDEGSDEEDEEKIATCVESEMSDKTDEPDKESDIDRHPGNEKPGIEDRPLTGEREDCDNRASAVNRGESDSEESLASLDEILLHRNEHREFLLKGLKHLSEAYGCLDASRPWMCFWIVHSLNLLGVKLDDSTKSRIAQFLARCQSPSGGFCGGPGQGPHLATSYAATMALCSLGTREAYDVINRERMRDFLVKMVDSDTGAVHMHTGGEEDVRAAYCAMAVARLTNIDVDDHFSPVVLWLQRCQTYEGGFGGVPGMEAHGGYAYCAYAALHMLNASESINVKRLMHWAALRQMRLEGGFQGRTNKLVDGCYSFWQGGVFPLLNAALETCISPPDDLLCNPEALQSYVLVCCQHTFGGLIDKPGKHRDFYHTCYCLSGLSTMQNQPLRHSGERVVGDCKNILRLTHPLFNVCQDQAENALEYFSSRPLIRK